MKEIPGSELPKDSEKQGYKVLLDTLRGQLLNQENLDDQEAPPADEIPAPRGPVSVSFPDGKKYFRIGEVAALIGVEAYVLRYWESEFGSIRPKKSRSGQRIYDRRDVEKLATVHHLLHVEKYSLQGAKQKIVEMRKAAQTPAPKQVDRKALKELAQELRSLMALLERGPNP